MRIDTTSADALQPTRDLSQGLPTDRRSVVVLTYDDTLIDSFAAHCLARKSGARGVDAFVNQRLLSSISGELLARMASGAPPEEIRLSVSPNGALTIGFVDRDAEAGGGPAPAHHAA